MKIKSVAVSLGLGILGSLSPLILSPIETNRKTLAQETAPLCPLPRNIALTFLGAKCREVTLQMPQTFFRYYSNDGNKTGRYLTTDQYQTNAETISNLALKQEWGNEAYKMLSTTLPAGTTVYQGIVAPQIPASCYPGRGQQTFIKDSRDPSLPWVEGPTLTKDFTSCP